MKRNYVLSYKAENTNEPVIWRLIKDFDLQVNILRAKVSPGQEGSLLVEIDAPEVVTMDRALCWLEQHGIKCTGVAKRIFWEEKLCVDCGACTGVCFPAALAMDKTDWKLVMDLDRCTACGLCVKACPFGCFRLDFGD
ncbi:NIL domain-containing protein [Spirochaetota bacterium]